MKKFLCILSMFLAFGGMHDISAKNTSKVSEQPVQAAALTATYNVDSAWSSGHQITVTLKNPSSQPTTSWTCTFTLPTGQTVSSLWNGVDSSSGQVHTVKNPTWQGGGVIPAGGSTSFGMIVQNPRGGSATISNLSATADGSTPPGPTVPTAPILNAITVSPSTPNSYNVTWSASSNATSYTLQQSTTSTFSNPVTIVQGNVLSRAFSGQPNGTYYYRVSASNASGTSSFSNVRSVTISSAVTLTAPVLSAISNPSQASQYLVKWNAVTNAQGYTLQESSTSSFTNFQTAYSGANTSFTVTGKANGTYYYRVVAYATNAVSPPSNVQSTTVVNSDPQPQPGLEIPFLESYWESWSSAVSVTTIANMKVDVINISFGNFVSTGTNTFRVSGVDADQATVTQLITAAHNAGKKVKIAIGGASYPIGPLLRTTADAVGMAQAVTDYVNQNNLDGVDIDIEDYPAANLQIAFIQSLRQKLGANALISYTPMTPAATTAPFNQVIQGAHTYLTDISFMAYNYGPGYTYQQDVQAFLNWGIPARKIVIGLMPGNDDTGKMTSLSDIQNAARYIVTNKLGGMMYWDLNRDHSNITGLGVDATANAVWPIFNP